MKVLHIGKYYYPFKGGIENFMYGLMPELAKSGIESCCLVHHHEYFRKTETQREGSLTIIRVLVMAKLLFVPISPTFGWHLRKAIKAFQPDVIHVQMPNVSAFWLLAMWSTRIPIVIHWQSDVVPSRHYRFLALAYFFYKPFEHLLLRKSAKIIATTPAYAKSSKPLQAWTNKIVVQPLGLTAKSEPVISVPESSEVSGKLRVLCVGRLTYYKGHEFLIEAIAKVENCELTLIGDGDRKARLLRLIEDLGISKRVRFLGSVPDDKLLRELADCSCLCLPSIERTEAFGIVLLEAMRSSKAVVVSDVEGSGMGWIVQDNETGLLTEPGSTNSLIDALTRLRDNPQQLIDMGIAGRARYQEIFTMPAVARRIARIYTDCIDSRPV